MMKFKVLAFGLLTLACSDPTRAQAEIQWWHSMTAVNGEWVSDLAKDYERTAIRKGLSFVPRSIPQHGDHLHRRQMIAGCR